MKKVSFLLIYVKSWSSQDIFFVWIQSVLFTYFNSDILKKQEWKGVTHAHMH